jgi:hypothetical protein
MPARNLHLTAARRRALTILVSARDGHTEAEMTAHGFSVGFLADLVRDGFATEHADRVGAADVVRLKITDEGRRALDF